MADKTQNSQNGKGLINEFKAFISRGNVMDLSVGIIVGGAFTAIVTALTNHILMPVIGIILGGINFSQASFTFKGASIGYGAFIQAVVNFFLIALTVFNLVKAINRFARKKEDKKQAEQSEEVKLLTQIRDLLQEKEKMQ